MRPGGNTSSNSSVSTARWVWLLDQVFLFGQLGVEPGDVADRVGVQVAETRTVTSSSSREMSSSSREDACRRSGPLNEALSSSSGSGQRASAVDTDSEFGRVLQRVVNGAVVAGADQGVYVDLAQFGRRVVDDVDMADPSGPLAICRDRSTETSARCMPLRCAYSNIVGSMHVPRLARKGSVGW